MHFGVAREHSHTAPPNNIKTDPADQERVLVIKRMANPRSGNNPDREARKRSSYGGPQNAGKRISIAFNLSLFHQLRRAAARVE